MPLLALITLSTSLSTSLSAAAPARSVAARADWIAIDRGAFCTAETPALRPPVRGREPGRLTVRFGGGGAVVQLRLSRVPAGPGPMMLIVAGQPFEIERHGDTGLSRDPAQVMAILSALRAGGWASARVRGSGPVMVDHYRLGGAPLAIDAAAACASAKRDVAR